MMTLQDVIYKDGVSEYLKKCEYIAKQATDIYLFGSARGGAKVYSFLEDIHKIDKIRYVVDNDRMKQGKYFHGIKIISVEELKKIFPQNGNAIIIIASGSANIIKKQLLDMRFLEEYIYPFVFTNLQTDPTPYQYFVTQKNQIEKSYRVLADDKSRDVFISLLNYKMTLDSSWLCGISDNEHEQYFDDIMQLSVSESFVDCGAYIGDTLEEYGERMKRQWKNYYCFEADTDIFVELKKVISDCRYESVELYNIGCWDSETTLYFDKQGSGSSSVTKESMDIRIHADALDHILEGKEVSIIKMDIEGAEQKALAGVKKIISRQHPKLAISIYHSLEDFIYLPCIMQELDSKYRIYVRHYRELTDSETVCYAVI
ncbi:MAG: FkbM family methyltransferase [Ruminococcus sp.]|nr:FkbM family methyltransferase [Ruminococcus sp.]